MDALKKEFYTYEDYCKFNDNKRREVINGVIYLMTAPLGIHQEILSSLNSIFWHYLRGKKCKVFPAPYDVRLPKEGETRDNASTVVQPDIVVVYDKNKLGRRGCFGSPDLVVEILSPSTSKRDLTDKFHLYQEHAVREYWVVDPMHQVVERFSFNDETKKYNQVEYFHKDDHISPVIFPELTIELGEVFPPIGDDYEY